MTQVRTQAIANASLHFVRRYLTRERRVLSVSFTCLLIWLSAVYAFPILSSSTGLLVHGLLILLVYSALFFTLSRYLQITNEELQFQDIGFVLIYVLVSLVLLFLFAFGWLVFAGFGPSPPPPSYTPNKIDSIYFASVIFSTLGFGDFIPVSQAGKLFVSFQAFLSSVHFVAFFSLLLTKRRV